MKKIAGFILAGALLGLAQAQGRHAEDSVEDRAPRLADAGDWARPLGDGWATPAPKAPVPDQSDEADLHPVSDIDVVDAHWMALTMWGEARNQGAEGMRAVGHVIHNRWREKERYGDYVTDTVSQAWQFSCWNPGDPNRDAMLNIHALPRDSADHALWLESKMLADEILAGRSADPTGGALFYHTTAVRPDWSAGVAPTRQIGDHLFFRATR